MENFITLKCVEFIDPTCDNICCKEAIFNIANIGIVIPLKQTVSIKKGVLGDIKTTTNSIVLCSINGISYRCEETVEEIQEKIKKAQKI